jgi:integrase
MADLTDAKRKSKTDRDFPLWLHPSGRWCRKIRGQFHYFGRDQQAAIDEWLRVKDDLLAGRPRPPKGGGLTVADLCNRFLTVKRHLLDTRELSPRTWQSYYQSCAKLVDRLGKSRLVDGLIAGDFEALRAALAKGRGPVTLRGDVLTIRMVFKYGYETGLIANPVRYGQGFKIPPKAVLRRARQAAGQRMFEADELRKIVKAVDQPLRAMVLLGVNAAYGATDISSLPESALDLDGGWATFPRPKTAIERRCRLWPETVAAIREVLNDRKEPKSAEDAGLVFLTRCRQRWVRLGAKGAVIDAVACEFAKVLKEMGIKRPRLGFYGLRHTLRTIADEVRDDPAVDRIMGHTDGSMADAYRERIEDARLERVANHVHAWIFPKPKRRIK